jgi:hypothetical protein
VSAGIGDTVGLYMDTTMRLRSGDFIQTGTGRTYEIVTVRTQTRGKHEGRQHIRATVVPAAAAEGGTLVPIVWYRR